VQTIRRGDRLEFGHNSFVDQQVSGAGTGKKRHHGVWRQDAADQ
jgi:hypothetical protein